LAAASRSRDDFSDHFHRSDWILDRFPPLPGDARLLPGTGGARRFAGSRPATGGPIRTGGRRQRALHGDSLWRISRIALLVSPVPVRPGLGKPFRPFRTPLHPPLHGFWNGGQLSALVF